MTRLRFRQPRSMHFRSPPESDFDLISTDDVTTPSFSDFYFVDENPFEIQENDCPDNLVFGQDPNWKDTIPLVGPKPFDMGDPGLTYSKINWTGQHTDIRMIMDEDRIDLTAVITFVTTVPFPFLCDSLGGTLLHRAALGGHVAAMRILIDYGHPVHVSDAFGYTPLHAAAEFGHVEAMALLIKHGHPAVVQDQLGNTALHHATSGGRSKAIALLTQHGHPPL